MLGLCDNINQHYNYGRMMYTDILPCFTDTKAIAIHLIQATAWDERISKLAPATRQWLQVNYQANAAITVPDANGDIAAVYICYTKSPEDAVAKAHAQLPSGDYYLVDDSASMLLSWAMAAYRYGKLQHTVRLYLDHDNLQVMSISSAIYWVRDLINTPANLLGPDELVNAAKHLTKHQATVKVIMGKELETNYPAIYAVGKASERKPRLLDIRWQNKKDFKKITLVGKGVCFDTGGLNLKPSNGMRNMKKDMAGAAHVLGLASIIMQAELPVNLRILIPVVDNAIGGNATMPGDVINTSHGKTVEIDNTDAEGRLILADALAEACTESVDLLVTMASLTGAASIGLATDLPSLFCQDMDLARKLVDISYGINDPIWHMPYHEKYLPTIQSKVADLKNATTGAPYGGAIKAALFLREFVDQQQVGDYLHLDFCAWNLEDSPGHPVGGEAMAIRALYAWIASSIGVEILFA